MKEDYDKVKTHLLSVKKNSILLTKHFFFNLEWWKQRVRMVTPKGDTHENNIYLLHCFVATDDDFKKFYNEDVKKYFEDFEKKCRDGLFEELDDVDLFRNVGVDCYGLDLWIRLRGSNRAENMHQKMKGTIGFWTVGAEIGYYLLVLLSYRYNISTGIKRYGDINFGNPYLHIIDRIQIRVQQIYDVLIFENYQNISLKIGDNNFVSVGIGELNYSDLYVTKGEPDERIKNRDILFMAKKMKLAMSPLPISHRNEIKIFNNFMKDHHILNQNNINRLAIEYKK